jgi:hypothetical protein
MSVTGAFQATGKTVQITTSSAAANNLVMLSDSPSMQYRLINHASQPVYVWISPIGAPVNVSIPTGNGANAGYAHVVPPASEYVISGPQTGPDTGVLVSARAESGTPELYVTPGYGR